MAKTEKENKIIKSKNVNLDILAPRLIFVVTTLILVLFGLIMVFSASSVEALNNNENPYWYIFKQAAIAFGGIVLAVIFWRKVPLSFWRSQWMYWLAAGVGILMVITLFLGTDIYGARRWIYIGSISIQPAEFAKIFVVIIVAKAFYEARTGQISVGRFLLTFVATLAFLVLFVFVLQSDLGTTIICIAGVLCVLWLGGAPRTFVIGLLLVFIALAFLAVVSTGYRLQRFSYFLDPYNDGQGGYGQGYQVIRSRYALAEGGIWGVGLGNSYEKFQYLPEAETDCIFAVICEELGMVGGIFTCILFIVFLVSGLFVAKNAGSGFGASVAGSFVIMIVLQAFINIFCVIGLFPTTGKPLPFISTGGSSIIASLAMVGIVLAASEEVAKTTIYEQRRKRFNAFKTYGSEKVTMPQKKQSAFAEEVSKELKKASKLSLRKKKTNKTKSSVDKIPKSTSTVKRTSTSTQTKPTRQVAKRPTPTTKSSARSPRNQQNSRTTTSTSTRQVGSRRSSKSKSPARSPRRQQTSSPKTSSTIRPTVRTKNQSSNKSNKPSARTSSRQGSNKGKSNIAKFRAPKNNNNGRL